MHRIRKGRVYCYETRSFIRMYPGICIAFDSLCPASSDSTAFASDPASGEQAFHYGGDVTLRILSGSENQELEGILDDFARERGVNIEMEYQGSLDIMRTLQGETVDYDAGCGRPAACGSPPETPSTG